MKLINRNRKNQGVSTSRYIILKNIIKMIFIPLSVLYIFIVYAPRAILVKLETEPKRPRDLHPVYGRYAYGTMGTAYKTAMRLISACADRFAWYRLDFIKGKLRNCSGEVSHCLDIGCGNPNIQVTSPILAKILKETAVCNLDIDLQSLHCIKTLCEYKKDHMVLADGQYLPFKDSSFDLALSAGTIAHIMDFPQMLEEIKRVLKPGGILYLDEANDLSGRSPYRDHVWRFNVKSLEKVVENQRFEIIETGGLWLDPALCLHVVEYIILSALLVVLPLRIIHFLNVRVLQLARVAYVIANKPYASQFIGDDEQTSASAR